MKGFSATAAVLAMARKDLRLLFRNRGALFFTFGWPVIMALAFGSIFGGGGGERGRIPVAVVDEDGTPAAARLVERLRATDGLEVAAATRAEAEQLVRTGKRTAAVMLPKGYGEASDRLFYGEPRRLEIAVDPARKAEAAMLEGILTGAAMQSMQDLFDDPGRSAGMVDKALGDLAASPEGPRLQPTRRFLGELKTFLAQPPEAKAAGGSTGPATGGWKPVAIEKRALSTERRGPANAFEVTFPQGMLWGVISCALGFAVSLVSERVRGTLMRLQTAPVSRAHVLAGKAVACLGAIAAVLGLLLALGWAFFGVRPASWALLAVAAGSLAACFVGIMMVVAVLGKTEQSAGGLGWAIMMPLTLLGGGMVPLFAMPRWMQAAGSVSPVKWGILALEGAIWRGFGPAEMVLPCGVLLAVGTVGFLLGARLFAAEG
jgi:ABC-2 type transport system permease protein